MENVELFQEFLNYKMAGASCYIFLLVFFVILACAQVLLWRLFTPIMSSKPARKPRVELTFYGSLHFFGFSSSSFTKSAEFVSLPGKASMVSISGAVLFLRAQRVYFPLRWRSNFDVISCLLLSCVLHCMEGEFEQIITKQGQQQVTPE